MLITVLNKTKQKINKLTKQKESNAMGDLTYEIVETDNVAIRSVDSILFS